VSLSYIVVLWQGVAVTPHPAPRSSFHPGCVCKSHEVPHLYMPVAPGTRGFEPLQMLLEIPRHSMTWEQASQESADSPDLAARHLAGGPGDTPPYPHLKSQPVHVHGRTTEMWTTGCTRPCSETRLILLCSEVFRKCFNFFFRDLFRKFLEAGCSPFVGLSQITSSRTYGILLLSITVCRLTTQLA
jgi:hypothetical protein